MMHDEVERLLRTMPAPDFGHLRPGLTVRFKPHSPHYARGLRLAEVTAVGSFWEYCLRAAEPLGVTPRHLLARLFTRMLGELVRGLPRRQRHRLRRAFLGYPCVVLRTVPAAGCNLPAVEIIAEPTFYDVLPPGRVDRN